MLSDIVGHLRCPVCRDGVTLGDGVLRCGQGHGFDVAKQGYVSLLVGSQAPGTADSPAMVSARAAFLAAGHYAPLERALADAVREHAVRDSPLVVDAGAGTGHYLAGVLNAIPAATGMAFDISKHAIRRAARAHERIGAFVGDVWKPLPIADERADVVIDVFAPRNGPEFARILRPGGKLIVVTPAGSHLSPLVEELGLLSVDEAKQDRIAASLREFAQVEQRVVEFGMALSHGEVTEVVGMGPSAWHVDPVTLAVRIGKFPEKTQTKAAFRMSIFEVPSEASTVP